MEANLFHNQKGFYTHTMDFRVFSLIIDDFDMASVLRTNFNKCSMNLIRVGVGGTGCPIVSFPLRYLGLTLALKKPTTVLLQYMVDNLVDYLWRRRASMLNRGGRLKLVS
jgi:hypothetical protein